MNLKLAIIALWQKHWNKHHHHDHHNWNNHGHHKWDNHDHHNWDNHDHHKHGGIGSRCPNNGDWGRACVSRELVFTYEYDACNNFYFYTHMHPPCAGVGWLPKRNLMVLGCYNGACGEAWYCNDDVWVGDGNVVRATTFGPY